MTKGKALLLSILFGCMAVTFYLSQNTPFMIAAIVAALLFLTIWKVKFDRDRTLANQARREREQAAQISQPAPQASKSNRLFVPPPLKEK